MITQAEGVRIVNEELTFAPTWKVSAGVSFGDMMREDTLTLRVEYAAVETDVLPAINRPVNIDLDSTFHINPRWSKDEFLRAVLNTLLIIHEHEAREMFKVNGVGVFNPHRPDGIDAWNRTVKVHQDTMTSSVI